MTQLIGIWCWIYSEIKRINSVYTLCGEIYLLGSRFHYSLFYEFWEEVSILHYFLGLSDW